MSERETNGNFKKIFSATTLGLLFSAYFGISKISHPSECVGEVYWRGYQKNISICTTKDGYLIAQKPNSLAVKFPRGICIINQITAFRGNKAFWYRVATDYAYELNNMDLDTGKLGNPAYVSFSKTSIPNKIIADCPY